MKKKGLIIATIVMVLVLAVSLTTATYAWFTVSSVTTIEGFTVEITNNSLVMIGMKADGVYTDEGKTNPAAYYNGNVNYTAVPGELGGTWSGTNVGLGATIEHNIVWGLQTQAVGMTSAATAEAATYGNTGLLVEGTDLVEGKIIAANGQLYNADTADALENQLLEEAKLAVANGTPQAGETPAVPGDFAHLFLGVQPVQNLSTNELVILLDASESNSPNIGILAAVHVAYRVDEGDWNDVEFFAGKNWNSPRTGLNFSFSEDPGWETEETLANAYKVSCSKTSVPTQAGAVIIPINAKTGGGDIAQVEIIIYIAGSDSDCNNAASVNVSGAISIFFHTVAAD